MKMNDNLIIPEEIIAGTLNRKIGYNDYKTNEVGTIVYESNDRYWIKNWTSNERGWIPCFFWKKDLETSINFNK